MFSVHTTPEEFKNAAINGHFGFVFEKDSGREIARLSQGHRFQNVFCGARKQKSGIFKFLRFEGRFRKAPFS